MIDKAFTTNIEYEENNIEEKTEEKFKNDQEIKNIISELYIKQKNSEYLFNKQRQTLKKFNIKEKIQREETKIINNNEEAKNNDIFNDAIQKLAACHMLGFEPLTVIRQKILAKIQTKYNIDAENMNQLTLYFESNSESDKELEKQRREKQIEVLNKLLESKSFNYKDVDKQTMIKVKNEIKKYEKDLELKASQNDDEDKIIGINQFLSKDIENNNISQMQEEDYLYNMENEDDDDYKIKITNFIFDEKNDINNNELSVEEFQKNLIKDLQKEIEEKENKENKENKDKENVGDKENKDNKDKENIENIENKENKMEEENENECIIDDYNEFKSNILNNFAWKMKYQKKLSDFDNQILLYVTHSIIDELNCAKKNKRDFNFIVTPQEMIKFLKEFQVEKIKDNFTSPNEIMKKSVSPSPNANI